jgi:hypothetical protein
LSAIRSPKPVSPETPSLSQATGPQLPPGLRDEGRSANAGGNSGSPRQARLPTLLWVAYGATCRKYGARSSSCRRMKSRAVRPITVPAYVVSLVAREAPTRGMPKRCTRPSRRSIWKPQPLYAEANTGRHSDQPGGRTARVPGFGGL